MLAACRDAHAPARAPVASAMPVPPLPRSGNGRPAPGVAALHQQGGRVTQGDEVADGLRLVGGVQVVRLGNAVPDEVAKIAGASRRGAPLVEEPAADVGAVLLAEELGEVRGLIRLPDPEKVPVGRLAGGRANRPNSLARPWV